MATTMATTYYKDLLANHIWHTSAESELPTAYYATLSKTEPLEDGTGVTEPDASSGFTRLELAGLSEAENGVVVNTGTLQFPKLTSDQGVTTHWAIFDAPTGGHLLMGGAHASAKHLDAGTSLILDPGQLTLQVLGA